MTRIVTLSLSLVVFLRDDLQPATDELSFNASVAGYALLRQRLEHIHPSHGPVVLTVRLDVAGAYATMICFVYDPDHFIRNPVGLKNDLEAQSVPGFTISVCNCQA